MVASAEDVAIAIQALSDSRRLQYEARAAQKGLTLSGYLSHKLDEQAIADARARWNERGPSTRPLTNSSSKGNERPKPEVIVIPDDDDDDVATKSPPAKRRRMQDDSVDEAALLQRMQASRPLSVIPQSYRPPAGARGATRRKGAHLPPPSSEPWYTNQPSYLDFLAPPSSQSNPASSPTVQTTSHPATLASRSHQAVPAARAVTYGNSGSPAPFTAVPWTANQSLYQGINAPWTANQPYHRGFPAPLSSCSNPASLPTVQTARPSTLAHSVLAPQGFQDFSAPREVTHGPMGHSIPFKVEPPNLSQPFYSGRPPHSSNTVSYSNAVNLAPFNAESWNASQTYYREPLAPLSGAVTYGNMSIPVALKMEPLTASQPFHLEPHARPSGTPPLATLPTTEPIKTICDCGQDLRGEAGRPVECDNLACPVGTFHARCINMEYKHGYVRCKKCKKKLKSSLSLRSSLDYATAQKSQSVQIEGAEAAVAGADESQPVETMVPTAAIAKADKPQSSEAKVPSTAMSSKESTAHAETEPKLSAEQKRVVDAIASGSNVFYTGSAGTGKSTVLKAFVSNLKAQGKQVDIVAPSGIAALAIGGTTIFSYAGWTPDSLKKPLRDLLKGAHGKNVRKRLCRTDCLVIDEISMVERDLLVRLDKLMREARDGYHPARGDPPVNSAHTAMKPFGGAQLIVTGDFCQLPPVRPFKFCVACGGDELEGWARQDKTLICRKCKLEHLDEKKWAFASETWEACEFRYIELSTIHRQIDKKFINILQTCRAGIPLSVFQQKVLLQQKSDPEGAVKLMPTRAEVDRENDHRFRQLPATALSFDCRDMFDWRNQMEPELRWKGTPKYPNRARGPLKALNDHRLEEKIDLKNDMLVILLVNLDFPAGLVNGSQGRIVGFEKYDPNKILVPTKPASTSPKKAYGKSRFMGSSQGTSRQGSGPEVLLGEYAEIRNAEVHHFMQSQEVREWPIVRFMNGVKRTIYASCQLNELGTEPPYSLLGRTQIPLLASWAITCHKSQGMTLNRVIVDLHNSFERGMVYVALSRATNLEGLKVVRLPKVMDMPGNTEVQAWLKEKFGKRKLG